MGRPDPNLVTPYVQQWTIGIEHDVKGMIYRHERAGFGRVYLRCWGSQLDNSHAVPDANPRWTAAEDEAYPAQNADRKEWAILAQSKSRSRGQEHQPVASPTS